MVFVAGNVLTAAELNAIGAWAAWTPTVTAESGTFTTVSGAGRYAQIGKTIVWEATITITTVGSATFGVKFTLPVTAQNATAHIGYGRSVASGAALQVRLNATTNATILRYDDASPIGAGAVLRINGTYEAA